MKDLETEIVSESHNHMESIETEINDLVVKSLKGKEVNTYVYEFASNLLTLEIKRSVTFWRTEMKRMNIISEQQKNNLENGNQ